MRERPPPETGKAGGGPGEAPAGFQSDIKENDPLGGGIDGAEPTAAADSGLGRIAEVASMWRAWLPSGLLLGAFPSRPEAAAALGEALGESAWDNGEPRVIEIYNGDDRLGAVCIGRSIRAVDSYGFELGKFATVEDGRRAVVRHAFAKEASS